jgi:hypothetical protein
MFLKIIDGIEVAVLSSRDSSDIASLSGREGEVKYDPHKRENTGGG